MPRVLHVLSLLVNLTDKRESVEGKRKPLNGHPELSERGTSWVGQPGPLSSSVSGDVLIQDGYL